MKNIILNLVFLCLPLSIFCQTQSIEHFYSKYKGQEDVTSINLTGDLINFVFANSDDSKAAVANKISNIRVLIVEESTLINTKDYNKFLRSVKKDKFEELMRIKDGGDAVDFHLREKGNQITDVLITVRGDDGFILLSVEGLFDFSDLNDFDLNIEGSEYFKKLPEEKKKIKRA